MREDSSVQLTATIHSAISTALWSNHVPVLSELTLLNDSDEAVGDIQIEISCDPPAINAQSWRLAAIGPRQMRAVDRLDLKLDAAWLEALTESVRGTVTFTARTDDRSRPEADGLRRAATGLS